MSLFAEFHAPVTAYPLSKVLSEHPGTVVELDESVPTGDSMHYLWLTSDDHHAVLRDLEEIKSITNVELLDELPDRALVRFEWTTNNSAVLELVERQHVRVVEATGAADGWSLRMEFTDQQSLREFAALSRGQGLNIELQEVNSPPDEEHRNLSDKQLATLELAFNRGYFKVPRQVTLEQLADELDVSEQGISERIRRGLSAYLDEVLSAEPAAGSEPTDSDEGSTAGVQPSDR